MASITTTVAAGSVDSPYFIDVKIKKQLCASTSSVPVFVPVFSFVSFRNVGEDQYEAFVNVQGLITFTPCGQCCARTQTVSRTFAVPFYSATAPTSVTVEGGIPRNALVDVSGCRCNCSNQFESDVSLTLTVVA